MGVGALSQDRTVTGARSQKARSGWVAARPLAVASSQQAVQERNVGGKQGEARDKAALWAG